MQRRSLLAGLCAGAATAANAQNADTDWPQAPVRLVVPFAAGGPTDIPARLLADEMSRLLPQRVVVENRTGSGVLIGTDMVAKAPKDGQTLLYTTVGHAVLRAMFDRLPFDPVADFSPVALVGQVPLVALVNKDFPVRDFREFIALVRANPGRYDYASSGNGGAVHLGTELFLHQAGGLRMNHIAFRGSAPAMPEILSGRIPLILDVAATALPYAARGEVRALAISTPQRSPLAPDIPTFQESGVAGYEAYTWHMVMAPAGTPARTILAANAAVNRAVANPAVTNRMTELAIQVVRGSTPESSSDFLAREIAKWEPIVRAAGIRAG
ncbi:tripartite tricarboxylate transporter substrate binding protein [Rhodovarius crocodyli]|uniref:Tripartite tricarboxylate transporter substrate binding protein n=1 Tax=Rhodovarius crocodyli TaxID=1979269 RepID=A0A437MNC6_9PROT|nr:tripartite tricarboxylate transporter substrate-binding protein [Rhodovarius crocodyli]RVT99148.1 tripartite tricarboxylate transporter substrate binding protein [Rhodovarius crocodyli]